MVLKLLGSTLVGFILGGWVEGLRRGVFHNAFNHIFTVLALPAFGSEIQTVPNSLILLAHPLAEMPKDLRVLLLACHTIACNMLWALLWNMALP